LFGKNGKRGFTGYAKLVLKEFTNFKSFSCNIENKNMDITENAMMISVANTSQFGNNAFIAPHADTNDGQANITVVKKMKFINLPIFVMRVFSKSIGSSPFAKMYTGEKFTLTCKEMLPLHIDGESAGFANIFQVQTIKNAIRLLVP